MITELVNTIPLEDRLAWICILICAIAAIFIPYISYMMAEEKKAKIRLQRHRDKAEQGMRDRAVKNFRNS